MPGCLLKYSYEVDRVTTTIRNDVIHPNRFILSALTSTCMYMYIDRKGKQFPEDDDLNIQQHTQQSYIDGLQPFLLFLSTTNPIPRRSNVARERGHSTTFIRTEARE